MRTEPAIALFSLTWAIEDQKNLHHLVGSRIERLRYGRA